MSEIRRPHQYLDSMEAFCRIPVARGVNNFVISGPILKKPFKIYGFAGMFPMMHKDEDYNLVIGYKREAGIDNIPIKYYSKILGVKMNDRIKEFQVTDDAKASLINRHICLQAGLPMFCFCFGKYKKGDIEAVSLYLVQGISPDTALRAVQNKARIKLSEFN